LPKKIELAKQRQSIEGYYKVTGKQATGASYNGIVSVKQVPESKLCIVIWYIKDSAVVGLGARSDDLLTVSWSEKGMTGLTLVRLGEGKTFRTEWYTLPGTGKALSETWTFWGPLGEDEDDDES